MLALRYLRFDASEDADGVITLEALASTPLATPATHAAVLAEVQQVLGWAWQQFPHSHGPLDDGQDWDHDLQVAVEDGQWHAVSLTLAASPRFAAAFHATFGAAPD